MCHHAMYMNNDHHFCICFMHMYNCLPSEAFSTHVIHHAALPMQPQRRHFCMEMVLQLHLIIFNRQVCYSA